MLDQRQKSSTASVSDKSVSQKRISATSREQLLVEFLGRPKKPTMYRWMNFLTLMMFLTRLHEGSPPAMDIDINQTSDCAYQRDSD